MVLVALTGNARAVQVHRANAQRAPVVALQVMRLSVEGRKAITQGHPHAAKPARVGATIPGGTRIGDAAIACRSSIETASTWSTTIANTI